MADRMIKHGILARSGVQKYSKAECLKDLHLPEPPAWVGDKAMYDVLRPAPVIASAVKDGKFNSLELTSPHPPESVTRDNARDYFAGWTGENAEILYDKESGEATVFATVVIADAEAADEYHRGVRQLSQGYKGEFVWRSEGAKDADYDAIMTRIVDANHMALVPRGRAGPVASILDHGGATVKSAKDFVSGVIRYVRRRRAGLVKDYVGEPTVSGPYDDGGFGSGLSSLISTRAAMKEEEVAEKVDELMKLVADLPGGDEKDLIKKYMSDMKLMKDLKDDELYDTKGIICSLVEKLDRRGEREAKGMKDEKTKDCASCDGTGKTKDGKDCASCGGSGHVKDAVRDEPGPVAATSGAPAAAAAPAPAAPAAPAAPTPAAGAAPFPTTVPTTTEEWADALMTFLGAMQSAMKPAAPAAAPAAAAAPGPDGKASPAAAPAKGEEGAKVAGGGAEENKPAATDAKSDPPPESGVPVQKPDGSDKPPKPAGQESQSDVPAEADTKIKRMAMDSMNAMVDTGGDSGSVSPIEAMFARLKGVPAGKEKDVVLDDAGPGEGQDSEKRRVRRLRLAGLSNRGGK